MIRSLAVLVLTTAIAVPVAAADPPPAEKPSDPSAASAPSQSAPKLSRRERKDRIAALPDRYREFLTEVEPIIVPQEVDLFLRLESDAQRDAFIDEFWARRDEPAQMTRGGFRTAYYDRLAEVRAKYRNVNNDRGRVYLIQGPPDEIVSVPFCQWLHPIEIWGYGYLTSLGSSARLVFYTRGGDYVLWGANAASGFQQSREALEELMSFQGLGEGVERVFYEHPGNGGFMEPPLVARCPNGDALLKAIRWADANRGRMSRSFQPTPINEEDVRNLLRVTVLADPKAQKLDVETTVRFGGSRGTRTITEVTMLVQRKDLAVHAIDDARFYNIDVVGETVKDGRIFERWRYRFDYPTDETGSVIPVVVERHLRPDDYQIRIKLSDSNARAEALIERDITVPPATKHAAAAKVEAGAKINRLLSDAGTDVVRIAPLPDGMLTGFQRIEAIVTGNRIASVEFYLDEQKIMTKRQPPWALELDLGPVPRLRRVKAVAYDAKGNVVDGDQTSVNEGLDPFRVRIVSPRFQQNLAGRIRVEIVVSVPEGSSLEKVELFLNDHKVGEMLDPPFVQNVSLPTGGALAYLRALATLKDSPIPPQEDVVIVNSPEFLQQVEVRLIELPTSVLRDGRPVSDLPQAAFHVYVQDTPVEIAKFEYIRDLKLSIGMAVDSSASMASKMAEAQKAGRAFFENVLKEGDRAFVVAFDRDAYLAQKWTASLPQLTSGLASLRAEESTALWDAVLYSLYNFEGVRGQRALVLLSDGTDTSSRFKYAQALEYAKRRGIPVYVIGLGIRATELDIRSKLGRIGSETGGNAWFVQDASELARVYASIEEELRSQYLLGFYSPDDPALGADWRPVRIDVDGAKAKTISGYYP